jgi:two-component system chemotaxis response regulator CheY
MRILVVDDSSAMRTFVRAAVEDELGAEVTEATSGFDALRLLPRDVIVVDVNMPDINGLELVVFIRKNPVHVDTRILMISTEAAEADQARGLKLGANAFLSKPFTAVALRDKIESLTADPSKS